MSTNNVAASCRPRGRPPPPPAAAAAAAAAARVAARAAVDGAPRGKRLHIKTHKHEHPFETRSDI